MQVFGTEDRVTDPAKKVAANSATIPFVTFPGGEIKDLYVHEAANSDAAKETVPTAAPPAPKADNRSRPPPRNESRPAVAPPQPPSAREEKSRNEQQSNYQRGPRRDQQQPSSQHNQNYQNQNQNQNQQYHHQNQNQQHQNQNQNQSQQQQQQPRSVVGTGSHLLKLRERKVSTGGQEGNGSGGVDATVQDFDFEVGNKIFNKEEVVEEQAESTGGAAGQKKYLKDDFFDNLSNDVTEKGEGRKTRLTASEERQLNTDTFGAIALQNNYRRGGRGGGRGGGGRGGSNYGYGHGRGYGNNNGGYNRGRGGNGYGQGQGQGRGGQGQGQQARPQNA